jgi:hypothetical protein
MIAMPVIVWSESSVSGSWLEIQRRWSFVTTSQCDGMKIDRSKVKDARWSTQPTQRADFHSEAEPRSKDDGLDIDCSVQRNSYESLQGTIYPLLYALRLQSAEHLSK